MKRSSLPERLVQQDRPEVHEHRSADADRHGTPDDIKHDV